MAHIKKHLPLIFVLGIIITGIFFLCFYSHPAIAPEKNVGVSVVATFFPLVSFAKAVGGDYVNVKTLIPVGVEPHDFEPSARDIADIEKSKVFIYNGGNFEPWVSRITTDLSSMGVLTVDSSQGIDVIYNGKIIDPHFWLDPVDAQIQVNNILTALVKADPEHTDYYRSNSRDYLQKLVDLDKEYRQILFNCDSHEVVSSHQALGYLAQRYGLNITTISGLSPLEEPSPKKLAEITNTIKSKNIKYIFFETLVSPKLAQTLATETGAKTLPFNPLEGLSASEAAAGKDYLSVQKDNLYNLSIALSCQKPNP